MQPYHLRVVTKGANIKVYFNYRVRPIIDYTDATPVLSGRFGLNLYNATSVFQDIELDSGLTTHTVMPAQGKAAEPKSFALTVVPVSGKGVRIQYSAPPNSAARVSLQVFDVHGRLLRTLLQGQVSGGMHQVAVLGGDARGNFAQGLYICRIKAADAADFQKAVAFIIQ